jgi:hypothetical protein
MAACRSSVQGRGELPSIGFIVESEINLGAPGVPGHACCIVSSGLLLTDEALQKI